jgi:Mg-chelatase subunit ChlD
MLCRVALADSPHWSLVRAWVIPGLIATAVAGLLLMGGGGAAANQATATPALNPADIIADGCRSDNPYFVTTKAHRDCDDCPAVVAINDNPGDNYAYPSNRAQLVLARWAAVGALYGVAYDGVHNDVYLAASHTPYEAFGPGGPGGVYRLELVSQRVRLAVRLPAGPDHHAGPLYDPSQENWVGKTSLGDIETDGGHTLFVMNLDDRRVYVFSLPDMIRLNVFAHGAAGEPWANNARPFGLGYRDGWLYHGVVDSREDPSLPGHLSAHIYRSRPDGSNMTEVASFGLDYPHEPPWVPWTEDFKWPFLPALPTASQPVVSDIEFRPNGDLIIGLAHRHHWNQETFGSGDVLPSRPTGPASWTVDTTSDHYRDDGPVYPGLGEVKENLIGALAAFPGRDSVVATGYLDTPDDGGLRWYDNESGSVSGPADGVEVVFSGDTSPIGDIESLCPAVVPPAATPTATPSATPTASPTATASATPTATSTPKPSATPTVPPKPAPIYLPAALKESCEARQEFADVALVLDVSTSMRRTTSSGQTKYDAVLQAAMAFVDLMHLAADRGGAHDQVAIVGFNDTAWLEQGLTADRNAIEAALRALRSKMVEGTRLDLALERGAEALSSPARVSANTSVLILLTDGIPNRVPLGPSGTQEETVLARAADAKKQGVRIYTIGVGRRYGTDLVDLINPALLSAVATDPTMYYETPNTDALAAIYAAIAHTIACPPDHFWARR